MDILVIVDGQRLKLAANQSHHIEGSNQFVKFRFDLSDEWKGLATHVQFIQNGEAYGQILDGEWNNKYAFLPNGIAEGECKMVLWGGNGDVRATTNYITLIIGKDISTANTLSENINRTDYEQALANLKSYVANGGTTEEALNEAFSRAVTEIATPDNIKEQIAAGITTAANEIQSAKETIENAKTEIANSTAEAKASEDETKKVLAAAENIKSDAEEALVNANEALDKADTALATAKDAIKARDEIIGKTGSSEDPEANSALDEIRKARNIIVGEDGKSGALANVIQLETQAGASKVAAEAVQEAVAADKASVESDKAAVEAAKNSVDSSKASIDETKQEIFGEGDTASPSVGSALREIRDTRAEVTEFNKTGGSLEQAKAAAQTAIDKANAATISENNAKESETKAAASATKAGDSEAAAKAIEAKIDHANESAEKIEAFRAEMATAHDEAIAARDNILQDGEDGKSVYDKVIEADTKVGYAKNQIIGSSETASSDNPDDNSALKKALDAAAAAAESAKSANQGITVVDNLNTDTEPTTTALSANQGKVLNETKLDKSGGVMTGALTLSGPPEEDSHAATKKYVDDHTPPVVTAEKDGLMLATDKTKLDGIDDGANNYTHPENHPASVITEDEAHRFVSDVEKTTWNNKVDKANGMGLSSNDYTTTEKNKLASIAENANNYTLPEATADRLGGVKIDDTVVKDSTKAITSKAVYERLAGLKFVVSTEEPTNADDNTLTIVIPG